ncbi:MAG: hypothetical protein QGH20_07495 [Candidatus Latescibacteria bacterium]|nr:hypothetical protein [Candidatus Latescibacterota bacterium]
MVLSVALESGCVVFDPLENMRDQAGPASLYRDSLHLSARGHRVLAGLFTEFLKSHTDMWR